MCEWLGCQGVSGGGGCPGVLGHVSVEDGEWGFLGYGLVRLGWSSCTDLLQLEFLCYHLMIAICHKA